MRWLPSLFDVAVSNQPKITLLMTDGIWTLKSVSTCNINQSITLSLQYHHGGVLGGFPVTSSASQFQEILCNLLHRNVNGYFFSFSPMGNILLDLVLFSTTSYYPTYIFLFHCAFKRSPPKHTCYPASSRHMLKGACQLWKKSIRTARLQYHFFGRVKHFIFH